MLTSIALVATMLAAVLVSPTMASATTGDGFSTPDGINFGYQAVGTTSAARTVTVTNTGDEAFVVWIYESQPASTIFHHSGNCPVGPATLAPGATCKVNTTFTPAASGQATGAFTIQLGSFHADSIALVGQGTTANPFPLSATSTGFRFGPRGLGSTSAAEVVTIHNDTPYSAPYTFTGASPATSQFKASPLCAASGTLGAGGTCQISYQFKPTKVGALADTASLKFTVNGISKVFPVTLSGWGVAPLRVTPVGYNFGDVVVGKTAQGTVGVTNVTDAPVTFTGSGGTPANTKFSKLSFGCAEGETLAAGTSCIFGYTFAPTATGALSTTATLKLTQPSTGWSSNTVFTLHGRGVANAATAYPLQGAESAFDWGDAPIGNNVTQTVAFTNTSSSSITANFAGGDFTDGKGVEKSAASTCTASTILAAGAYCTFVYAFHPSVTGPVSVTTSIGVDVAGQPYTQFPLKLTGNATIPQLYMTHITQDHGQIAIGSDSAQQGIIVHNGGTTSVTFTDAGGGFYDSQGFGYGGDTCGNSPITLAPGASCQYNYAFHPKSSGPAAAHTSLGIYVPSGGKYSYDAGAPLNFTGYGTGSGPQGWADTNSIQYGSVSVGKASASQSITLHNTGTAAFGAIVPQAPSDPQFTFTNKCPASLLPGKTCTIDYVFTPTKAKNSDVSLYINTDAGSFQFWAEGTGRAAPGAVDDNYNATINQALLIGLPGNGVFANDSGIGLHITGHSNPSHGTVTMGTDGTFTYTPTHGYTGADSWIYVGTDSVGGATSATVHITVKPRTISDNTAFVKAAYQDFLNRLPNATELSTTVTALDAATKSRPDVVSQLSSSTEWVSALVNQLYINTLGRNGEPSGLAYWSNQLITHAKTVAQVSAGFYASPEYFNGFGGGTNAGWITDLYAKLLQRVPDAAGISYWSGQIASFGRTHVAFALFQSPESCARRVTDLYQKLLGRNPDVAGRTYWAGQVAASGDIVLAANLAASDEYFGRAQSRFP